MKQELITFPEHMRSFLVLVAFMLIFSFLAIVLSVHLQITTSDYSLHIFYLPKFLTKKL